ncbi:MAG TPA: hypothetical protein VGR62_15040 [Candidatus Binatia bacterium]|nr:hypothetical protein [Candidatus Binatia bacterium]
MDVAPFANTSMDAPPTIGSPKMVSSMTDPLATIPMLRFWGATFGTGSFTTKDFPSTD